MLGKAINGLFFYEEETTDKGVDTTPVSDVEIDIDAPISASVPSSLLPMILQKQYTLGMTSM